MREESGDVEEAEGVRRHPEQKLNVEEDVVGSSLSLGVCKSEGGRFKVIARGSVQG